MKDKIFEDCHEINQLLIDKDENVARHKLIKLLDFLKKNEIKYNPLINHLIRETGLFPYIEPETSDWEERYIYNVFKVNVGNSEALTLHREQSSLLKKLLTGKNIAVSAPTSFGKSFVIDAFIKIKKPNNVMIIVPTLALTDETRRRIHTKFAHDYKIITTSDEEIGGRNIFIFPQERAINYINKVDFFDILIIDEFYKASNKFDKDRAPSLVKTMIKFGAISKQKYYLAPNIMSIKGNPFTDDMEFIRMDFSTVYLEKHDLYRENNGNNEQKSKQLLKIINENKSKTLIYAGSYSNIDSLSNLFMSEFEETENSLLILFSDWLTKNYDYNWTLTNLVKRAIGVHNGRLHRSLSQIQIKLFEENSGINSLISTSSIIEGVNTSAENVIIWRNRKGQARLDDFTYKNIIGRGGRMFKHFIGKIYILEKPPIEEQTQLDIPFPDEIIGDLDKDLYQNILTKDQIAKIKIYENEMITMLGFETYEKLTTQSIFKSNNSQLIKKIALDIKTTKNEWNGLQFLNNAKDPNKWDRLLYKIINLQPGNWETSNRKFVEFIKIICRNWTKTIPQLLNELEIHDIGIDDFFKLERNVTYKLSALLQDINTLQKEILKDKDCDISRFINWCSHAFLPKVVYQLEEYGLPRMISKKLYQSNLIDFLDKGLTIHSVIDFFNEEGLQEIIHKTNNLDKFDIYIMEHFFEGIRITK